MNKKFSAILAVAVFVLLIVFVVYSNFSKSSAPTKIKVLSYSSFLSSWGPAAELATVFRNETGIEVQYQDGDDAGLLLTKLDLFPSDLVIGLDSTTSQDAENRYKWKSHGIKQDKKFANNNFVAFDWSPLTFIYRDGEIKPPKNFADLLSSRFRNSLSLEDPRTSAPGLQFLFWLVAVKGEDEAFSFLKQLKPNIRAVSPSWSTAYGLFQKKQAKLAFSYLTSPVYHWVNEKDFSYKPAILEGPSIYQVELAGIPKNCNECDGAMQFLKFLVSNEGQKIIMKKNVMLPVNFEVLIGSEFAKLPTVQLIDRQKLEAVASRKKELIDRWKTLEL